MLYRDPNRRLALHAMTLQTGLHASTFLKNPFDLRKSRKEEIHYHTYKQEPLKWKVTLYGQL